MTTIPNASISVDIDPTNPGQFFACCGLLEIASRLWPGAEGWFDGGRFFIAAPQACTFAELASVLCEFNVANTMSEARLARLALLSKMQKPDLKKTAGLEDERKALESMRRESPIVLKGRFELCIDWFRDVSSGGSRFKTWAGQQSVLDIAAAMHRGMHSSGNVSESTLWDSKIGTGLPFNFDSDLGAQGSGLDIGFSMDALAGNQSTRLEGECRPALELLSFIGLQRFRPRRVPQANRYVYACWTYPLGPQVAAAAVCQSIPISPDHCYEFRLLYRTKYLKSFLPSIPFQGDEHE